MGFSLPSLPPLKLPLPDITGKLGDLTKAFNSADVVSQITGNIQSQQGAIESMRGQLDDFRSMAAIASAQAQMKEVTSYATKITQQNDVTGVVAYSRSALETIEPEKVQQRNGDYVQGLLGNLSGSVSGLIGGVTGQIKGQIQGAVSGLMSNATTSVKGLAQEAAVTALDAYIQGQTGGAIPDMITRPISEAVVEAGMSFAEDGYSGFESNGFDYFGDQLSAYADQYGYNYLGSINTADLIAMDSSGLALSSLAERALCNSPGLIDDYLSLTGDGLDAIATQVMLGLCPDGSNGACVGGINTSDYFAQSKGILLNAIRETAEAGQVKEYAHLVSLLINDYGEPYELVEEYTSTLQENMKDTLANLAEFEEIENEFGDIEAADIGTVAYKRSEDNPGLLVKTRNSTQAKIDEFEKKCKHLGDDHSLPWFTGDFSNIVDNYRLNVSATGKVDLKYCPDGTTSQWMIHVCKRNGEVQIFDPDEGKDADKYLLNSDYIAFHDTKTDNWYYPVKLRPFASSEGTIRRKFFEFLLDSQSQYYSVTPDTVSDGSTAFYKYAVDISGNPVFDTTPFFIAKGKTVGEGVYARKQYTWKELSAPAFGKSPARFPGDTLDSIYASLSSVEKDLFLNGDQQIDSPFKYGLNDYYSTIAVGQSEVFNDITLEQATSLSAIISIVDKQIITMDKFEPLFKMEDSKVLSIGDIVYFVHDSTETPDESGIFYDTYQSTDNPCEPCYDTKINGGTAYYILVKAIAQTTGATSYAYERVSTRQIVEMDEVDEQGHVVREWLQYIDPVTEKVYTDFYTPKGVLFQFARCYTGDAYSKKDPLFSEAISSKFLSDMEKRLNTTENVKNRYGQKVTTEEMITQYRAAVQNGSIINQLMEYDERNRQFSMLHHVFRCVQDPSMWLVTFGDTVRYIKASPNYWSQAFDGASTVHDFLPNDNIEGRKFIIQQEIIPLLQFDEDDE